MASGNPLGWKADNGRAFVISGNIDDGEMYVREGGKWSNDGVGAQDLQDHFAEASATDSVTWLRMAREQTAGRFIGVTRWYRVMEDRRRRREDEGVGGRDKPLSP